MHTILIIYDAPLRQMISPQFLKKRQFRFKSCPYFEFKPENVLLSNFYLLIFELRDKKESCLSIIQKIRENTVISGENCPPIFLIVSNSTEIFEHAARVAKVDFYFTQPINEKEFFSVIERAEASLPV